MSWRAIHVAGTNGKGSITGYLSALLAAGGVRCGAFTSPHLIDWWDCITIDERVVQESVFRRIEGQVKQRNQTLGIGATEFELLTATAFEIFEHEQVEVGVVEVGLGGRLDATNILKNVIVSVISKIGLDHQALLGHTIEEIAREKAGIMKPGARCFVDGTNIPEVRRVLEARAEEVNTVASFVQPEVVKRAFPDLAVLFKNLELEPHQEANISCAVMALHEVIPLLRPGMEVNNLLPYISKVQRPGRLQQINIESLVGRNEPVLLDGAHNLQSAEVLSSYVDRKFRQPSKNVTWLVAASRGKDIRQLLGCIVKPGDNVAAVRFGAVNGMPWVQSVETADLLAAARSIPDIGETKEFDAVLSGLIWANKISMGAPLVIAGSLYLVSDVLRLLRDRKAST
jgi:folylpolyglutamate synthase